MKVTFYSARNYEKPAFDRHNRHAGHEICYHDCQLNADTAVIATGSEAVCLFINDCVDKQVIDQLRDCGVRLLALRSAGYNHVDLAAAAAAGMTVARVPAYSPHAVAEHTVGLLLSLNRRLHRAYQRVREGDFTLDGLMGFDLNGKTVGVIGAGNIGSVFIRIMQSFGCRVLAYDIVPLDLPGVQFVPLDDLLRASDIVSLHCPLTPDTQHLINADRLALMKPGVTLLNTGRGALLDTRAVIAALKTGHIGLLGLDVYEEEASLFFRDMSETIIQDDVFARLLTFPNVMITSHQAFFTYEAVDAIAQVTLDNISCFEAGREVANTVTA